MLLRGRTRRPRRIVFVFPGGAGASEGARQLYRSEHAFRASVERCDEAVSDLAGSRPIPAKVGDLLADRAEEMRLYRSWFRSVLLGVIQIALCDLWASLGVMPDATLSLSLGELVAAYAAGALTRAETVAALVSHGWNVAQGRLLAGRLLLVSLDVAGARTLCEGGPESLHVLGSCSVLRTMLFTTAEEAPAAEAHLASRGVTPTAVVQTDFPWHTSLLGVTLEAYQRDLSHVRSREPRIPVFSALHAGPVPRGTALGADFFFAIATQPFFFSEAIDAALEGGPAIFVSVGADNRAVLPWISENAAAAGIEATLAESLPHAQNSRAWPQARRTLRAELRRRGRHADADTRADGEPREVRTA